jgi:hypothetical protein
MNKCGIDDCNKEDCIVLKESDLELVKRRVMENTNHNIIQLCPSHFNQYVKFYCAKQKKQYCNPLQNHGRAVTFRVTEITLEYSIQVEPKFLLCPGQYICKDCKEKVEALANKEKSTSTDSSIDEQPGNISSSSLGSEIQEASRLLPVQTTLGGCHRLEKYCVIFQFKFFKVKIHCVYNVIFIFQKILDCHLLMQKGLVVKDMQKLKLNKLHLKSESP